MILERTEDLIIPDLPEMTVNKSSISHAFEYITLVLISNVACLCPCLWQELLSVLRS